MSHWEAIGLDLMRKSWRSALQSEIEEEYFKELAEFVEKERQISDGVCGYCTPINRRCMIYPPKEDVFRWTCFFNISDVKVVILGQDPYHGPNEAHGLCFSVNRSQPTTPSLGKIFDALHADGFRETRHGDLTHWADQGVLLLNSVLTVHSGMPGSHANRRGQDGRIEGWERFTNAVINYISEKCENVVFMLWGGKAQEKIPSIGKVSKLPNVYGGTLLCPSGRGCGINYGMQVTGFPNMYVDPLAEPSESGLGSNDGMQNAHLVLTCSHPTAWAHQNDFVGCKHFSKANKWLRDHGKIDIDWNIPDE